MLDVEALSGHLASIVAEEVEKAIAPLHARISELEARDPVEGPKGEKGDAGEPGSNGVPGVDGKDGRDGRGVKDLLIDRDGNLVATMDDGEMKMLGPVIGKDGKDGERGKDGFGFEDMDACVLDDDRTIELSFRRGDEEKAFTFKWPTMIYREAYKEGGIYQPGDTVTRGGQLYVCTEQTDEESPKPEFAKDGRPWRLAVRKGRDGKDAKVG